MARRALDGRPDVPATVHVHVNNAAVTLTGNVRLPSERAAAEEAVRHVAGIRSLLNRIVVAAINPQGVEPPDDRD